MVIDERLRHELHQRLDDVLGVDEAVTLMAHLPPTGWGDVVAREYLDMALHSQDARIDTRFAQVDTRFAEVDARLDQAFARIEVRFAEMDGRFDKVEGQIVALRHELIGVMRGELIAALAQQTRQTIFAMIGTVLSLAALARFI